MAYLGEEIPKFGFGLMRLPKKDGHIDIDQVKQMVDEFLAAGFTYFDTARGYGESEAAIRQALVERYPRESYQLATKLAAWLGAKNADEAKAMFNTSLEQTGAGYFDFYLLHNFGAPRTQIFDDYGIWDFVRPLVEEGKIRHLGISTHSSAAELEDILDKHGDQIEFVQFQLNWADWEDGGVQSRKIYELLRERDILGIIMEPVKGGILLDPPDAVKEIFARANPTASLASLALRYAADREGLITVLSGMSSLEQMRENIETFKNFKPLNADEKAAIALAQAEMDKLDLIPCTSCDYCAKVCGQKILISGMFLTLNRYRKFQTFASCKGTYQWYAAQGSKASECIECGLCMDACPQNLPITTLLKEVAELFEQERPGEEAVSLLS